MIYIVASLVILAVAQTTAILILMDSARTERYELSLERSARAGEFNQFVREQTDRLMAVMSEEENPLFSSMQATSLRATTDGALQRPGEVQYVDEEREYELERAGNNGNDEEA